MNAVGVTRFGPDFPGWLPVDGIALLQSLFHFGQMQVDRDINGVGRRVLLRADSGLVADDDTAVIRPAGSIVQRMGLVVVFGGSFLTKAPVPSAMARTGRG